MRGKAAVISVTRVCPKCGAEIPVDAPEGGCPGCLLESGLRLLDEEAVAGGADLLHIDKLARTPGSGRLMELLGELGDYELLEEVGRGGQGVVFRARQKSLDRTVALKVISLGQWASKEHLRRFRREAEAAARLEHPGIVPIHEVGERDGFCYFSMQFIEGGQLDEVVEDAPMPIRRSAELVAQVARTVHYAHEHGILHRDIKPGNILLDEQGEPHLTDFGLARLVETESTVTRTLEVLGTPSYMAPEQATGSNTKLTNATDVYGLGAVLYQLLTGHLPFVGGTPYETIKLVIDTEPRPPRSLNPKIDRELSTICMKCLEKDPKRRYSSALALAEDLDHWLKHEPIRAKRSGFLTYAGKWVRRNPAIAALIASLAALAAAMGWNVWESGLFRAAPEKSIAVLPFENLSRDPENVYFADGVQDEIRSNLARVADLKVIGRTSVMQYKSGVPRNLREIGRQLGVANVLEGSVQRFGNRVRVSVHLADVRTHRELWGQAYDRELADVFAIQSEIAKGIAASLQAELTGREEQALTAKPTNNPQAYDAYLRGLAYTFKPGFTVANTVGAQKHLKEAVALDPRFALCWALLSEVDAESYLSSFNFESIDALREEARQAAETALTLQPDLGEAMLAKGIYHYAFLKDYDTAVSYFERARPLLPNKSRIPAALAYVARRQGQWERSDAYFNEAERLDPRNVFVLTQHAWSDLARRNVSVALRKLDYILDIAPGDVDTLALKAGLAQAEGDLQRASGILDGLQPTADQSGALETQVYQAILKRQPAPMIRRLTEILATPDQRLGYVNGELYFWLGWAQKVAGDNAAAQQSWRKARSQLEPFLNKQPENIAIIGDLTWTNMGLGDQSAALALAERAAATFPLEKDAINGSHALDIVARCAALRGDHDRAINVLQKLLSIRHVPGALASGVPLTPALLRLDPMFDSLRGDSRFQKLCQEKQP